MCSITVNNLLIIICGKRESKLDYILLEESFNKFLFKNCVTQNKFSFNYSVCKLNGVKFKVSMLHVHVTIISELKYTASSIGW